MARQPGRIEPLPLQVECVTKAYRADGRHVAVLDDVSITARPNEFVTLIGPSGCGKSTLLSMICGLLEPDRGTIRLYGRGDGRRLGHVAYMPQKDMLLPWRSLLDNIILGPEVTGQNVDQAREEALSLLSLFGLKGFESSYPSALSGGMRQRASLLRTFMLKQEIMLLDEPLGALDALTRRTMRAWLLDIWEQFRQTVVFVTHDVEEAVLLSDRVYVLSSRPGHIVRELNIDLPRPRSEAMTGHAPFVEYTDALLAGLGL